MEAEAAEVASISEGVVDSRISFPNSSVVVVAVDNNDKEVAVEDSSLSSILVKELVAVMLVALIRNERSQCLTTVMSMN